MKVQGNCIPQLISVGSGSNTSGRVEVRIRENITKVSDNLYEYDEYKLYRQNCDGLKEEIEANFDAWLATGRNSEVNMNASLVQKMRAALVAAGVDPDTI